MEWLVWMLAGIGAFFLLIMVIFLPLFLVGGLIALKRERLELLEEIKGQKKERLPSALEAETLNEKDPLESEQAGENVLDDSTIRK